MSLSPTDLHGAWVLDDWFVESEDGSRTAPFGRDARGAIMYTEDGYMTAIVSAAERFLPADSPADDQKAAAFSTYFNYAGRWTIDGDAVTHRVELALDPNLVGVEMTRAVEHQGNRMVFSGTMADGKTKNVIIWKRR
jgi:hypothetical protein